MMRLRWNGPAVAVTALALGGPFPALAEEGEAVPTVPPGVTLVEVVRELSASAAQMLWTRLGDEEGRTLLFAEDGRTGGAACVAACAGEFPPLLAPDGAEPFADWSLLRRADGRLQWAYQLRPLHTWSREEEPGEVATNVGLAETANVKLAERPEAAGGVAAAPGVAGSPASSRTAPSRRPTASRRGWCCRRRRWSSPTTPGFTLYAFDGDAARDGQGCSDGGCDMQWLPVTAPALALDVGDFSVVSRADGSRQWAHRGRPLYRYRGDLLPGDAHGRDADARWRMAVLTEGFRPPRVAVTALEGYGDALSLAGMTLYSGSAFQKYWGGRNLRDSFKNAWHRGKRLGGDACADEDCLALWRPFHASADARSTGFFEVIARGDGTRQWAYKGYALYTYADDEATGHNRGQATYSFAKPDGGPDDIERAVWLAELGDTYGGGGRVLERRQAVGDVAREPSFPVARTAGDGLRRARPATLLR